MAPLAGTPGHTFRTLRSSATHFQDTEELGTRSGHPGHTFRTLRSSAPGAGTPGHTFRTLRSSAAHTFRTMRSLAPGVDTPGHTSKSLRQWLVRNTPLTACVCNWAGVTERQPTHYSARQTAGT